jgi:hypothetical protein
VGCDARIEFNGLIKALPARAALFYACGFPTDSTDPRNKLNTIPAFFRAVLQG